MGWIVESNSGSGWFFYQSERSEQTAKQKADELNMSFSGVEYRARKHLVPKPRRPKAQKK